MGDASGTNGEGLQIGDEINFDRLGKILKQKLPIQHLFPKFGKDIKMMVKAFLLP